MKGLFITFEGVDGCGKSTQAKGLARRLAERGVDVVRTREPGGTPLGQKLRPLLLDADADGPVPVAEMLLMAADRAHHVRTVIVPALERGAVVIGDRYVDSSIAYQAGGLGLPEADVRRVNEIATGGLRPHMTLLLDLAPQHALQRASGRIGADRIEERGLHFQQRVLHTYEQLMIAEPDRWERIDVNGLSVDDVALRVDGIVEPLLRGAGLLP